MKTTPGPWHTAELEKGEYGIFHTGPLAYVGYAGYGTNNSKANAYLIAAAPDLLEACKLAYKGLCKEAEDNGACISNAGADAQKALVEAISKATGGEK